MGKESYQRKVLRDICGELKPDYYVNGVPQYYNRNVFVFEFFIGNEYCGTIFTPNAQEARKEFIKTGKCKVPKEISNPNDYFQHCKKLAWQKFHTVVNPKGYIDESKVTMIFACEIRG